MPEDKITFTPEQQAKLDEIINKRFGEIKAENAALKEENAELLKIDTGNKEDAADLKNQLKAVVEERKSLAILKALTRHQVIDIDAAAELLNSKVYLDKEGKAVGLGPDDKPRLGKTGGLMEIDEYVSEFLTTRSYLVKASPSVGAGSQSAGFRLGAPTTMRRAEFDALSSSARMSFTQRGGKLTD